MGEEHHLSTEGKQLIQEVINKLHTTEYDKNNASSHIQNFLNLISEFKLTQLVNSSRIKDRFELEIKQEYWRCKFIIQMKKSIFEGLPPTNINEFYKTKLGGNYYNQTKWTSVDNIKNFFDIENMISSLKEYCFSIHEGISVLKPNNLEEINMDKPLVLLANCLDSNNTFDEKIEGLHIFFPQGEKSVQKAKREHFGLKKDYTLSEINLLEEKNVTDVKFETIELSLLEVKNRKFIGKCKAIFENRSTINILITPFKDFKKELIDILIRSNCSIIDEFLFFKDDCRDMNIKKNGKRFTTQYHNSIFTFIQEKREKYILLEHIDIRTSGLYVFNEEEYEYKFIYPKLLLKIEKGILTPYIKILFNEYVKNSFVNESVSIFNKQFYLDKNKICYDAEDNYYYIAMKYGDISEIMAKSDVKPLTIKTENYISIGKDFKKKTLYVLSKENDFYRILKQVSIFSCKSPEFRIVSNEPIMLELSDDDITKLDKDKFENDYFKYERLKEENDKEYIYYYLLKIKKTRSDNIYIKTSQIGDKHQLIFYSGKNYSLNGKKCNLYVGEHYTNVSSVEIYPQLIRFSDSEEKKFVEAGWAKNFNFEKKCTYFSSYDKKIFSKERKIFEVPSMEMVLNNIRFNQTKISLSCSSNNLFKIRGTNIDVDNQQYLNLHDITINDDDHTMYVQFKSIEDELEIKKAPFIKLENIPRKESLLEEDIKAGRIVFTKNYFENKIKNVKINGDERRLSKIKFQELMKHDKLILNISFQLQKKEFQIKKELTFHRIPNIDIKQEKRNIQIICPGKHQLQIIIYSKNNPLNCEELGIIFVENEKIIHLNESWVTADSDSVISVIDVISKHKEEKELINTFTQEIYPAQDSICEEKTIKTYLTGVQYVLLYLIKEEVNYEEIKESLPYYGLNNYDFILEIKNLIGMELIKKSDRAYLVTPKGERIIALNHEINSLITKLAISIKFSTITKKLMEIKNKYKTIFFNNKLKYQ